MTNRIRDLQIDEVSLVDRGAIRRKFLLLKADDDSAGGETGVFADNEHRGKGVVAEACKHLVTALEQASDRARVDQEFVKTTGCSFAEWDGLDEIEKQRRRDDAHARGQIEHLESRLDEIAAKIKRKDETPEQAYVRAMRSEEGCEICRQLNSALAARR